jgi:hypothetical protein
VRNENKDVSNRLMCNDEKSLLSNLLLQQVLASIVKNLPLESPMCSKTGRKKNLQFVDMRNADKNAPTAPYVLERREPSLDSASAAACIYNSK